MRSFVKENLGRMARNHLWVNDEGAELPTFVQAYQFFARNPEQNSAVRVRYGPQIRAESAAETRFGDYSRKVTDPSGVIRRHPSSSQDTVSVRVKLQTLIPGVQDAEEADLRAQMMWIAGHLQERLCTGVKQQVEDHLLVLQRHWRQFARQSEYRVDVASGQKLPLPRREPAQGALPWHLGQCRLPHELKEMATWPQSEQRSR